jgi:unsaturated rhamnogalacturonyl hydrolase
MYKGKLREILNANRAKRITIDQTMPELETLVSRVANYTASLDFEMFPQGEKPMAVRGLISSEEENALHKAKKEIDRSVATQTTNGQLSYGSIEPVDLDTVGPVADDLINGSPALSQADPGAMGFCVLDMFERTGDDLYLKAADKQYKFLQEDANRTGDGGITHLRDTDDLWVDSLYMLSPFFAKYGSHQDDPQAYSDAVRQLKVQATYLQDPHADLFRHIWRETPNDYPDGSFWSRGNGWVTTALVDTLELLPDDHEHREDLMDIFLSLCEAIIVLQDKSGLWHHILDDPDSYLETSGSLMFSYAFKKAIENDFLTDEKYEKAAHDALDICMKLVNEEGGVERAAKSPGGPDAPIGITLYSQGFFLIAARQYL